MPFFSATSDKMDNTIIYNNLYIFLFSKAVSEYVEEGGLN